MKTALLIDDDRASRLILSHALAKKGWNVFEAEDGEAGMVLARQHHPHIVVCDLLMPRFNGFQVCRALREQTEAKAQPKIIVTTASCYATDRINAFEAGADEFVIKPIKPSDLLNLVEVLLKEGYSSEFDRRTEQKSTTNTTYYRRMVDPNAPRTVKEEDKRTVVRFWGVRGSIPTPGPGTAHYGGNTSCVEVRADGHTIILDAGTGIRPLGLKLIKESKGDPMDLTVLLTHTHWDHIQGFPFFIPAYNPKNQLRVLGYEGARKGLEGTLSSQMESPYFPISLQQMPGYITIEELKDMAFKVGPINVQASFMNHPGVCVGYRLNTSHGSVAYMPDNEPFFRLKSQPSNLNASDHADALAYARDRDQRLIDFIRDVDVLIIDSQYDATEYPKHVGWGHTCVDDSVAFAVSANVKNLFLFHHDPGHDDAHIAKMERHARELVEKQGAKVHVEAAREGVEVVLGAVKPAS